MWPFITVLIPCTQILHFNGVHSSALGNDSRLWLHYFGIWQPHWLLPSASFNVWSFFDQYAMMISYTFDRFLVNFFHIKHYHLISMLAISTLWALISWSIWVESMISLIICLCLYDNNIMSEINQRLCGKLSQTLSFSDENYSSCLEKWPEYEHYYFRSVA